MNKRLTSAWMTATGVCVGVWAALAGSLAPAQAQGYGYPGGYGGGPGGDRPYGGRAFRGAAPFGGRLAPNASWSEIDKTPRFNTDSRSGFYIWRQGDDVYIAVNAPNRGGNWHTSGDVRVMRGSVSGVRGYKAGPDDHFRQVSDNGLVFEFNTGGGIDGVHFRVKDGRRIVINLQGDGPRLGRVYLGQDKVQTFQMPIVIEK